MRIGRKILFGTAAFGLAALVFGFLLFASHTTREGTSSPRRANAIVALTGGARRIRSAGNLLKARMADRLLISGVNRVVKQGRLQQMLGIDDELFKCCVDVDYAAQNTRGNAIETRKWALRHRIDSLIVVTSSYHMPRSLTELGRALPAVDLVAHPVVPERFRHSPWWLDRHNIMLLGAEYLKFLPSAAQFNIDRLVDTPRPPRQGPSFNRAVAIQ